MLFANNIGTNGAPVFKRPAALLFDTDGSPMGFWQHAAHMAPVDWDGYGVYKLIAGADQGYVRDWKLEHFGKPATSDPTAPPRPKGEAGLGKDD